MWLSRSTTIEPLVWFEEWPQNLRNQLYSSTNPKGAISIPDLKLTGIFMHFLALKAHLQQYGANLRLKTVTIWYNNLPAVAWT